MVLSRRDGRCGTLGIAAGRTFESEVVAQRGALVVAAEDAALLQ